MNIKSCHICNKILKKKRNWSSDPGVFILSCLNKKHYFAMIQDHFISNKYNISCIWMDLKVLDKKLYLKLVINNNKFTLLLFNSKSNLSDNKAICCIEDYKYFDDYEKLSKSISYLIAFI